MFEQKISKALLEEAGLIRYAADGKTRDFFQDRIMIPVSDAMGSFIGFSSRKYKESTFGGKYINTPETPLFKKKRILFGLSFCRKVIAKERKVIIVEGQFDALRLIHEGFCYTVAAQGTAFGEDHAKELLHLGVNHVYLALDADKSGQAAAEKIGDMFQKEAIEVSVVCMPIDTDPDTFLREKGPSFWEKLLEDSISYLDFLIKRFSSIIDITSPAGKNELVQQLVKRVRSWKHPLMIHESLKKIARLTNTPEAVLGISNSLPVNVYLKKQSLLDKKSIDPDRVLEMDLLRWLFLMGETKKNFLEMLKVNLSYEDFHDKICQKLFSLYLKADAEKSPKDLLSLALQLDEMTEQSFLSELLQKKVNQEKAYEDFVETLQKILDRNWMKKREEIKCRIHSGQCSDDEVLLLAKQFDEIKKQRPQIIFPEN